MFIPAVPLENGAVVDPNYRAACGAGVYVGSSRVTRVRKRKGVGAAESAGRRSNGETTIVTN
jgi:hypothetical protein